MLENVELARTRRDLAAAIEDYPGVMASAPEMLLTPNMLRLLNDPISGPMAAYLLAKNPALTELDILELLSSPPYSCTRSQCQES